MKKLLTTVTMAVLSVCLFLGVFVDVHADETNYSWPSVSDVVQTGLATDSITVSWTGTDVASYNVYVREASSYEFTLVANTTQTSYTIPNMNSGMKYTVKVEGIGLRGDTYTDTAYLYDAVTTAKKLRNVHQKRWWHFIEKVDIEWDKMPAMDGYEYVMKSSAGKTIKKGKGTVNYESVSFSVKNNELYTFRVRGYMTVNGSKYYTDWSQINCFEQAWMKSIKISGSSMKISWTKIKGATGYDVYVSTNKDKGYTKVKSVGKNTTSITIKKLKKKKISAKTKYFVYVVTKKKKDGSGVNYIWDSKTQGKSFSYIK